MASTGYHLCMVCDLQKGNEGYLGGSAGESDAVSGRRRRGVARS
jgi:hypothetical protein